MNRKPVIVFILLFMYFMIPKIDLISMPGTVTGIRLQDLITFFVFIVLFDCKINKERVFLLFLFTLHLLYSILFWQSFTSIYGYFRMIEYFFVAKGIIFIIESGYWRNFFNYTFVLILITALGQYVALIPNIDPGRGIIYSNQFSGPFGTPTELTYFMITAMYLSYQVDRVGIVKFTCSSLVLLNGVKAGILGFLVLALQHIKNNIVVIVLLIIFTTASIFLIYDYVLIGIEFIKEIFARIAISGGATSQGMNITDISEESLRYRVDKWSTTLVQLIENPLALIFGFGVYSYTSALDGGILKFLFEFGFLPFLMIMFILFRISRSFFFIVIAVSTFFDSYTSSVTMPVLIATFQIINKKLHNKKNEG